MGIKFKIILLAIILAVLSSAAVGIIVERLLADEAGPAIDRREAFGYLGVLFFFVAVASVLGASWIMSPVDDLIIGTQLVAQGRLDHKIGKRRDDELGRLVDSFNRMTTKLKVSYDQSLEFSNIATVEKQKAELIIDSMADSVIVTDSSHHIVLFNPAAERMFGVEQKAVLGRHIMNFLKQFRMEGLFDDFPEIRDKILPVKKPETKMREFDVARLGRILKAATAPLRNESSVVIGTVVVIEDITKEKELDRMKTDFVSTVSHELRTPLTSIKGYAAILLGQKLGALSENQKKAAEIIDKESDRLADLISDILDLSKLEAGKAKTSFKKENIGAFVSELPVLAAANAKGINIETMIPKDLPEISVDRTKILQVFNNLLSNAIKFTTPGGKISIKMSFDRDFLRTDIADSGVGIPQKDIPKLFNKFYQVESHLTRNQGGTGLGLPIVKEIIGLHHGLLAVRSTLRKGTTVSFALPRHGLCGREQDRCWESRGCTKTKCPAFQSPDKRCWLYVGTYCKKRTNEPCLDKIQVCRFCSIYKQGLGEEESVA